MASATLSPAWNMEDMEAVYNNTSQKMSETKGVSPGVSCLAFQLYSGTKLSAGSPHLMANQTLSPGDVAMPIIELLTMPESPGFAFQLLKHLYIYIYKYPCQT